ncbi:hypothetical protein DEU34_1087 [Microbacterium sp. AG1240]|uniref:hypothetical protein n=1 Tax=Microbacterium sp. AG1240 TaxID=2183992 RepID=UPI000EABABCB|nr:hypothetical protein [Microbacterium sp. AG1240]RKT36572.1 hypothetical protein DEU34_1087 [Microbacterium sp. AG1240]
MQIALALLIAVVIGVALHVALPHRQKRGVVVAPAIAAAAGVITWAALTWAGVGIDNPWIWLSAITVPAVVTAPLVLALGAARVRGDERERRSLGLV